jgi:sugar phosphate isomerase/epimerase
MLKTGTQTKNVVYDDSPAEGYKMLKKCGFDCCDFSLNAYLLNTKLYKEELNNFFDKTDAEFENFFAPHKKAAADAGITINQMHMPYPNYVPNGSKELNDYLMNVVAPKSMKICAYLNCPYIVVHGFKLAKNLGSEEAEWQKTEEFLNKILPLAKENGTTICIENIYTSTGRHIIEGPCCNVKKAVERIDRINDKYGAEVLGFCFDTGHGKLVGLDFESFITSLDYRLKVLHIHDNDGIGDLHQIPFTFTRTRENTSSTDWDGFVRGLKNIKFNKVLSFETAPVLMSFPDEMKEDALKFIAKIGRYFSNKIEEK